MPIKRAKKVAGELAKKALASAKKKAKKIACSHPKDKRKLKHIEEANATVSVCTICKAKLERVNLPPRKTPKPGPVQQRIVAAAKEKNPLLKNPHRRV